MPSLLIVDAHFALRHINNFEDLRMKISAILASAVFAAGLLSTSQPAHADPTPVGPPVCDGVVGGCYQMYCDASGCSLVFIPGDPFKPKTQEN
jgi:hypothetical protein